MAKLFKQPVFLLVLTGFLIGLNFPLGKIAGEAGISPLVWALLISVGVVFLLFPMMVVKKSLKLPAIHLMKYAVISGSVSFVAANILLFLVIPHVGSGYSGLMFALSPVFTLAISIIFGFSSPSRLGLAGIAVGFAGATVVALSRQSLSNDVQWFWIFVAALIPLSLAIGNVYRSLAWPKDSSPDVLAFWSHFFFCFDLHGFAARSAWRFAACFVGKRSFCRTYATGRRWAYLSGILSLAAPWRAGFA